MAARWIATALIILSVCSVRPVLAEATAKTTAYQPIAVPEAPDMGQLVIRLVLATLIVSSGCVGTIWIVKHFRNDPTTGQPSSMFRHLGAISLGQRCSLHLVDVDGKQVLVATDPSGVKSVTSVHASFDQALESCEVPA